MAYQPGLPAGPKGLFDGKEKFCNYHTGLNLDCEPNVLGKGHGDRRSLPSSQEPGLNRI